MKNVKQADIYDVIQDYLIKGKLETYSFEPSIGFSSLTYKGKDGFVLPSEEDLKKEIPALQASIDATQYQRDRAEAYPDLAEQFDLLWHAIDDGKFNVKSKETDFYKKLKAVKDANPKPE